LGVPFYSDGTLAELKNDNDTWSGVKNA
jgi:hypothetical protein